ncbi:MAG TPA: phosphopantetheine-binding protein [Stellaceae bacterium]|nr:phosphopantetheine-binding protein [Stellaceae bacterium]
MTISRSELGLEQDYVAPRSETEKRLAEIWRAALNLDEVGVEDSYFWLPGDSLIAARIFAEIERVFGVRLPMSTLVTAKSVALLAERIDRTRG